MSAPSLAPTIAQKILEPDLSTLVTEDDAPVDNIYSERQMRLLTEALYMSWPGPPPEEDGARRPFVALANVGVYGTPVDPPVVPDVLLCVDVSLHEDVHEKKHKTWLTWVFGKSPDLVIEVVSNTEGAELTHKKKKYRDLHVPAYVVWDTDRYLSKDELHVFELRGMLYVKKKVAFFEALGLGLAAWEGTFEGYPGRWLRWVDAKGKLLPTGEEATKRARKRARQEQRRADEEQRRADEERERAEQERKRADEERERAEQERKRADEEQRRGEQERERAERLAARLRAMGLDPDDA